MASNTLSFDERLKIGKQYETAILEFLNGSCIVLSNHEFKLWYAADREDDIKNKIDAHVICSDGLYRTVQIKQREAGSDVGVAMIMPYTTDKDFLSKYDTNTLPWDRDMRSQVDIYVCQIGELTLIAEYSLIKKACLKLLEKLYEAGGFGYSNSYKHPGWWGAELKLVRDRGAGYSKGQRKIICYLAPELLMKSGARLLGA